MRETQPNAPWLSALPLLSPAQIDEVSSVFRRALVESPMPTVLTEPTNGMILGCNEQFQQMLRADEVDLHAKRVQDLVHPDDRAKVDETLARLRSGETKQETYEARWVRTDGQIVWTRRHVLRVDGPAGDSAAYLVGVMEDLTELRLAQRLGSALVEIGTGIAGGAALEETVARLAQLAEARWSEVGCFISVLDPERNVLVPICPNAGKFGLPSKLPDIPVGPGGGANGIAAWRDEPTAVTDVAANPHLEELDDWLAQRRSLSSWAMPLHTPDGDVIGTIGVFHPYRHEPTADDWAALTSVAGVAAIAVLAAMRRQSKSAEQRRVRTDPRTGLLNDVALMELLEAMLELHEPVTVAVATLRGPGQMASHDAMSRHALTTLATRASSLGQVPHVAVTGVTSLAIVARAEWDDREAQLLHRVLTRPIDFGTATVRPEVAVGVVVPDPDEKATAAELLARATLAVPSQGGIRVLHHEAIDDRRYRGLAADVARALRQGEFVVHYQPQFDLVTGSPVGSEALVRWHHPHRGPLAPAEFMSVIECTGASTDLAFSVVRSVVSDAARRHRVGLAGNVAVNITADDLLNESFVAVLRNPEDQLWRQITLELTEAQFARPEAVTALDELAAIGYAIALDDFGTGYSALSAIHTLPVSTVKIDRSFVARLPHDASAEALIAAIIAVCKQLGITVVAEGIETQVQALTVRDLGCRLGQGYLLGYPLPLSNYTPEMLKPRPLEGTSKKRKPADRSVSGVARRRLFELHQQGASPTTIAAALNRSGYRAAGGTRWHTRSVLQVLNEGELAG